MQEKANPFSATKTKNAKKISPANFTSFFSNFSKILKIKKMFAKGEWCVVAST